MATQQYKILFLVAAAFLTLLMASPVIQQLSVFPQIEPLTELSLLGPYHNATYPYRILSTENHRLYVNVKNYLGYTAYYNLQIKFRNQSQSAPDSFNGTYSQQPILTNKTFSLTDKQTWELPIDISLEYAVDEKNPKTLNMKQVVFNDANLNVENTKITWDSAGEGFYGNLLFELWLFNSTINGFQYHQRYVSLWLKMDV